MTTRPMPGADGKRLIYRLAGVDADWQPAPKNERESRPIIAAYRILAEGQVQSLEEAHRRIAYLESLLNERYGHPAATGTGGDGAQPNQTGPAPETVGEAELSNRNDVPVQPAKPDWPGPREWCCGRTFQPERRFRFNSQTPQARHRRLWLRLNFPTGTYVPVHQPADGGRRLRRPSATTGPY